MYKELRWMLDSITHLLQAGDFYGAFAMCLNAIEPLAAKRYPNLGNGERFQRFLHEERQSFWPGKVFLPDADKARHGATAVLPDDLFAGDKAPDKGELEAHFAKLQEGLISIEQVLWKYCRNPIVHEGAQLAVNGKTAVTLDWSVPETSLSLKVDQAAKNVIVISAPYLLNALHRIVAKHLADPSQRPLTLVKAQSIQIVSWTMSQEREFIENLLCQRFNFFMVFFGLIVAGAFATRSEPLFCSILWVGAFVSLLLATTLFRAQMKLDFILEGFFKNHPDHPATIVHEACKDELLGSARRVIGYGIPLLCTVLLFLGAFLASIGRLGPG